MAGKQPTWAEEVERENAIAQAERQSDLHAAILDQQRVLEQDVAALQEQTRQVLEGQNRNRRDESIRRDAHNLAMEALVTQPISMELEEAARRLRLNRINAARDEGYQRMLDEEQRRNAEQRRQDERRRRQEERDTNMRAHSHSDMRLQIRLDNFGTYTILYRKLNGIDTNFKCKEYMDSGWPEIPVEHLRQLMPDVFLPRFQLGYMFTKAESFVAVHIDFYCEKSHCASDLIHPHNIRSSDEVDINLTWG